MLKAALFIDGTWFLKNTPTTKLFKLDYANLYKYITTLLSQERNIDITNTMTQIVIGSAINVHPEDEEFRTIREKYILHMQNNASVTVFPTNFKRNKISDNTVREKFVDVALASMLCYYASVPNVFDVAILLLGDRDFIPAIDTIRHRFGKQIAIVSYNSHCAGEYIRNAPKYRDFDLIWLTPEILDTYDLSGKVHTICCESPLHEGNREIETDFWPQPDQKFYCEVCRNRFSDLASQAPDSTENLQGEIIKFFADKSYGFILAQGGEYFFHNKHVINANEDFIVAVGRKVRFDIEKHAVNGKQGAACKVTMLE